MMVRALSKEHLAELKQDYLCQLKETDDEVLGVSYGELVEAESIPDAVIFDHYEGICFT